MNLPVSIGFRGLDFQGMTNPVSQFLHRLLMASTHGTLVVAENGDLSITVVVKLDLLVDCEVLVLPGIKILQQV